MKHVRLELRITLVAHAGEDINPETTPERDPETVEAFRLVRTLPLEDDRGFHHRANAVAAQHLPYMFSGVSRIIAERLTQNLRQKGL